jgi:hypothetical protein
MQTVQTVLRGFRGGDYLKRQEEIYEELHPVTKKSVARGKARQGSTSEIISLANDTSVKTSVSKRTVEHEIQIEN